MRINSTISKIKNPFVRRAPSAVSKLDNRVKTMNNEILKIDQEMSEQLGLPVDTDRVARADGKKDARKD